MPSPKRKPSARVGPGRKAEAAPPKRRSPANSTPRATRKLTTKKRTARRLGSPKLVAEAGGVTIAEVAELDELRRELEQAAGRGPLRWNADPDDVQRSVAQLVLTLVEFIRKLLERQAIRRMDAGTLTEAQIEDIGRALMTLEETIVDMARRFGLSPDDLNLDLGPIGKLI
jgi:hypothetical protein